MVEFAVRTQERKRNKREKVNGFPAENELKDLRFKLANNLQTTLHLSTTIELFFDNIQELVQVDGLKFTSVNGVTDVLVGTKEKHSASYSVASSAARLGNIQFFRSKIFLEVELATLEMLIGVLFFPLRNAILYQEALEQSMRDTLTGIGNRSAMESSFEREIKLARRHGHPLSLLVFDIDNFKIVNDTLGHQNGDKVIKRVAKTIQSGLRETDQIFRFGGEEFVALLHNTDLENARIIAERIRLNVALTPIELKDDETLVSISVGVSELLNEDSKESFFERADSAMYDAKKLGRNRVVVSDSIARTA